MTGDEDSSKMFFLTAEMIKNDFPTSIIKDELKFRLYGASLLNNNKYIIQRKKNTLDRIENKLIHADFTANRQFISWSLPSTRIDTSAISPDFKEPIDNLWGNIPEEFKKIKDTAYLAMIGIEEIYDKFKSVTLETNPLKAFEYIQDIESECNKKMEFQLPKDMYDEDFERACYQHLEKVENLRVDGLLDNFLNIKTEIFKCVSSFLCQKLPFDPNTVHSIFIDYSLHDYTIKRIHHKLTKVDEYWDVSSDLDMYGHMKIPINHYYGIKDLSIGKFECFWLPGRIYIDEKFKNDLKGFYKQTDFRIYSECMDKMYYDKY